MSNRISEKQLQELCDEINTIKPGHIIGMAYGGYCLYNKLNGYRTVSHDGYGTKRQLWAFMRAYLSGLQDKIP